MAHIPTYLHNLARRTTAELWKAARREPNVANLVFANHRETAKHRVSEQESRCIAQRLITESGYFFSIETPTKGTFEFRGWQSSGDRAAQHDLSHYTAPTPDTVVGHREFKQRHRSEKDDTGITDIYKDPLKLVDSGLDALWFHLFSRPTRNGFSMLRKFFTAAMPKALAKAKPKPEAFITLALCSVLEQEGSMDLCPGSLDGGGADLRRFPNRLEDASQDMAALGARDTSNSERRAHKMSSITRPSRVGMESTGPT